MLDPLPRVAGQGGDYGVVDLERGVAGQLGVGRDRRGRDWCGFVEHLVGERQPDAVQAEAVESGEDLGERCAVQAERDVVGDFAVLVVRRVGGGSTAEPVALGAVPVPGLEFEANSAADCHVVRLSSAVADGARGGGGGSR